MERSLFLSAVEAALSLSASAENARTGAEFARQACTQWLARWPGDFRVRAHLADAQVVLGAKEEAIQQLLQVMQAEPEAVEPYRALAVLYRARGETAKLLEAESILFGLGASSLPGSQLPDWADTLQTAFRLQASGRWQEARLAAESVMASVPDYPLPALIHLKALYSLAEYPAVLSAGKAYRTRWPACPAFLLLMAQACFGAGQNSQGVEFLYAAVIADPASEISDRYLGSLNPYKPLWPARREAEIETPVPGAVTAAAGWNRLASPPPGPSMPDLPADIPVIRFPDFDALHPEDSPMAKPDSFEPVPGELYPGPSGLDMEQAPPENEAVGPAPVETAKSVPALAPAEEKKPSAAGDPSLDDLREQLNRVAKRLGMKKPRAKADNRRPACILLTSRKKLATLYGSAAMAEIEKSLQDLLRAKRGLRGWSAYLVDPDSAESLKSFELMTVDSANAWQVKSLLGSLDSALMKRGERVAALMIIGGHEVIPFHLLPNPADDDDRDVPSDNPYATRDENYYVPEWPVGRFPAPPDANAGFLLGVLRRAAETVVPAKAGLLAGILAFFMLFLHPAMIRFRNASGISAGVWRKASAEVFRVIGSGSALLICPPENSKTMPKDLLSRPKYSYFNLHGLENGPEWLGQTDPNAKKPVEVEFPVALLPEQVADSETVPAVVYTEACYGANILRKRSGDSIALEFLAAGTRAMVGSTKISYGAASAPLIAADLLGKLFLQYTLAGLPAGDALHQAKLTFAEETHRRQGYLDPEDQKTLISFVLLGDPLYAPAAASGKGAGRKNAGRRPANAFHTLDIRADLMENGSAPTPRMQAALKKSMHQYLPGMSDSRMRYLHPRPGGLAAQETGKRKPGATPRSPAWVVAVDRKYQAHGHEFTQFAKVSLDASGRVVKMVVSR